MCACACVRVWVEVKRWLWGEQWAFISIRDWLESAEGSNLDFLLQKIFLAAVKRSLCAILRDISFQEFL